MDNLIKRARNGDIEALEALWKQTKQFAFTVSRRFYPTAYADSEDLQQCAYLGFHGAVMRHEGRYSFLSLVQWCIQRECQKLLDLYGSRRQLKAESLDIELPDGEHTLADLVVDESLPESGAALEETELVRDVRDAVSQLPEREQQVIKLHWFESMSLSDTGKALEISTERARQLETRAFTRLRADPVIGSYAPQRRRESFNGGLSYFQRNNASSTELDAIARISRQMEKQRRREEKESREWKRWLQTQVKGGVLSSMQAEVLSPCKSTGAGL